MPTLKPTSKQTPEKAERLKRYQAQQARKKRRLLLKRTLKDPKVLAKVAAGVVLVVGLVVAAIVYQNWAAYHLSKTTRSMVGVPTKALESKLALDPKNHQYVFNKAALKLNPNTTTSKSFGLGPTSVSNDAIQLNVSGNHTITITDSVSQQAISTTPQFPVRDAKEEAQHIVYPLQNYSGQLVYTMTRAGLKEDVVLPANHPDTVDFSYTLSLPKELQARKTSNGSIGIYSADPSLFGNITYGTPADQARVEAARLNSPKNNLLFTIPAPLVHKDGSKTSNPDDTAAYYTLKGTTLTVTATHLKNIHTSLDIDPSVLVNSNISFAVGNNEGNIDYGASGTQLNRGALTGGSISAGWSTETTTLINTIYGQSSVAYNGYIYALGGCSDASFGTVFCNTIKNDVEYATISTAGVIGTWNFTHNSLNDSTTFVAGFATPRFYQTSLVYNGYIYVIGGCSATSSGTCTTEQSDVQYAPLNSDGTVGTWAAANSGATFTARFSHSSVAYNGYMYVIGGCGATNCSSIKNDVQYAPIRTDGTLGAWASAGTALGTQRFGESAVAYNNHLYVIGGCSATTTTTNGRCTTLQSDVQVAPINSNGTIGTWVATTSFTTARENFTAVVYNGYLYIMNGCSNAASQICSVFQGDTQYATVNADGALGTWVSAGVATNPTMYGHSSVVYNGYLFVIGGCSATGSPYCLTFNHSVQVAKIDPAGVTGSFTDNVTHTFATAVFDETTVAYNGFLYVIGGCTTSTYNGCTGVSSAVRYAPLNADGTVGSFTSSGNSLVGARYGHGSFVYNGRLYVVGGCSAGVCTGLSNDVQYSGLITSGNPGAWTDDTTNTFTAGRFRLGVAEYAGYVYVAGGCAATVSAQCTSYKQDVQYATINPSTGDVGSFNNAGVGNTAITFSTPRAQLAAVASSGYLYIMGGCSANTTSAQCTTFKNDVQYASFNSDGTINAFSSATTFSATGLMELNAVASNGYLYIMGGCSAMSTGGSTCNTIVTATLYAPIGSNGAPGTWSTGSSFAASRYAQAGTTYNGYVYVAGGCVAACNGNSKQDTEFALLGNGGTGALSSSWTTAGGSSFSTLRYGLSTVAYNGFLYVMGGNSGSFLNDVQYAPINNDGSIGTWAYTHNNTNDGATFVSGFMTGRQVFAAVAYNGFMYIMGGCSAASCATDQNDVQFAPINANGTIGTWAYTHNNTNDGATFVSGFTTPRYGLAAVAYNGFMYIMGGCSAGTCTTSLNDAQYAPINANGTIGTWASSTPFTTIRNSFSAVAYNGYIYIMGGANSGAILNDVQYIKINSDGSLPGSWSSTTSFATSRYGQVSLAENGYIYMIGGCSSGGCTAYQGDAQYASINSNGTLGPWMGTTSLGTARDLMGVATYNGYVYIAGGSSAGGLLNDVQYAGQLAMPRIGSYSRMISTELDDGPNRLLIHASNTGNPGIGGPGENFGGVTAQYKFASSTCSTFSALSQLSTELPGIEPQAFVGPVSFTTDGCSTATGVGKYMWVDIIIDDSQTASFPDINSNDTVVTDFEYYYHPIAIRRLRGGATFNSQVSQSLDTSPD